MACSSEALNDAAMIGSNMFQDQSSDDIFEVNPFDEASSLICNARPAIRTLLTEPSQYHAIEEDPKGQVHFGSRCIKEADIGASRTVFAGPHLWTVFFFNMPTISLFSTCLAGARTVNDALVHLTARGAASRLHTHGHLSGPCPSHEHYLSRRKTWTALIADLTLPEKSCFTIPIV
jgi:hypothetical protein